MYVYTHTHTHTYGNVHTTSLKHVPNCILAVWSRLEWPHYSSLTCLETEQALYLHWFEHTLLLCK